MKVFGMSLITTIPVVALKQHHHHRLESVPCSIRQRRSTIISVFGTPGLAPFSSGSFNHRRLPVRHLWTPSPAPFSSSGFAAVASMFRSIHPLVQEDGGTRGAGDGSRSRT